MNEEDYTDYECYHCVQMFTRHLWELDRAFEKIIFGSVMPEIETINAEAIGTYCSGTCMDLHVHKAMAEEEVPIPAAPPGIGPVETCAICKGPVDMAKFHLTYRLAQGDEVSTIVVRPHWSREIAVVCNTCRPPRGAAVYEELKAPTREGALLTVDGKAFDAFTALVDEAPASNAGLERLLAVKPPWDGHFEGTWPR